MNREALRELIKLLLCMLRPAVGQNWREARLRLRPRLQIQLRRCCEDELKVKVRAATTAKAKVGHPR